MTEEPTSFAECKGRHDTVEAAKRMRRFVLSSGNAKLRLAWAQIETYIAISMRVMDRTPMEEINDARLTEEIRAHMDGRVE